MSRQTGGSRGAQDRGQVQPGGQRLLEQRQTPGEGQEGPPQTRREKAQGGRQGPPQTRREKAQGGREKAPQTRREKAPQTRRGGRFGQLLFLQRRGRREGERQKGEEAQGQEALTALWPARSVSPTCILTVMTASESCMNKTT